MPHSAIIPTPVSKERPTTPLNGWLMLAVNLALLVTGIFLVVRGVMAAVDERNGLWLILGGALLQITAVIFLCGHFTLQPNEGRVLLLFGEYHGTVRESGFFWANPFYSRV